MAGDSIKELVDRLTEESKALHDSEYRLAPILARELSVRLGYSVFCVPGSESGTFSFHVFNVTRKDAWDMAETALTDMGAWNITGSIILHTKGETKRYYPEHYKE